MRELLLWTHCGEKLGAHSAYYVDPHSNYATHLQCLMACLIYFPLCVLLFYSTFMMLMVIILLLLVAATKAPASGLNIHVSQEEGEATYVGVPLVPQKVPRTLVSSYFSLGKCVAYLIYHKLDYDLLTILFFST